MAVFDVFIPFILHSEFELRVVMDIIFASKSAFLILMMSLSDGTLTVHERTQLIKSVSIHFNRRFIILLSHKLDGLNDEIILEKYLNDPLQFFTSIWDSKKFTHGLYSDAGFKTQKALVVSEHNLENLMELNLISKRMNIAAFDWLVLPGESSETESLLENITIPFNCRFIVSAEENNSVVLKEIYKISLNSEMRERHFGRWSSDRGLHDTSGEFYNNRIDLMGHEFKFAIHNLSGGIDPCQQEMKDDKGGQMVQCAHSRVWNDFAAILNYTTRYAFIDDCYTNGTAGISTPMLEMIRSGGADTGNDGYIWSSSRLSYYQFFFPLFDARIILVTKIPSRKFSFSSYVHPFSTGIWLALIGWLLLSGVIVIFTKHVMKGIFRRNELFANREYIEDSFLPLTAICYQGSSSVPKETAIRFVYLLIYLIPVVFIPSYSGSIISALSVPSENVPFNDLNGFLEDGRYKMNAVNSTFLHLFLTTDEIFFPLKEKKLISTHAITTYEESFKELCSEKVTFLYDSPLLTKHSIKCNVFKFDFFWKRIFSSMAVQKNFPYLELFNRHMQKLISGGLNMKILEKATLELFKVQVNPFPQHFFQQKPFGFGEVLPLFAVLCVGMGISIFLFFIERHVAMIKK